MTRIFILLFFTFLISNLELYSQDKNAQIRELERELELHQRELASIRSEKASPEARFDLKFEGGSVIDFLAATKNLPINLIVPEAADQVKVPKFEVSAVTDVELFSALNVLLLSNGPNRVHFETGGKSSQKNRVWALSLRPHVLPRLKAQETPKVITHSVSIGPLLEEFSIDAITTAIAQSVEIFQKSHAQIKGEEIKPVNIAFHPETKLLIMSGPEKSMTIATDTLTALFDGVDQVRRTPTPQKDD